MNAAEIAPGVSLGQLLAATLQGAIFAAVRAAVDRAATAA